MGGLFSLKYACRIYLFQNHLPHSLSPLLMAKWPNPYFQFLSQYWIFNFNIIVQLYVYGNFKCQFLANNEEKYHPGLKNM